MQHHQSTMDLRHGTQSILLLVYITFFKGIQATPEPSEHFERSVALEKDDVYHLFWKTWKESITFEVHVKTKGWVGFGLSPYGNMSHSDIVIGWVKEGIPYFTDRYAATHNSMPTIDPIQDWQLLDARETLTHTVLKFKRPLLSCDERDLNITDRKTWVVYSFSESDPVAESSVPQHSEKSRGSKRLHLLGNYAEPPTLPSDVFSIDYVNNKVDIPNRKKSIYWCRVFKAPEFTEKHHLIKVNPIIEKRTEAWVQHMVIYACYAPLPHQEFLANFDEECEDWSLLELCPTMIAVAGTTSKEFNFPEKAGFAFGPPSGPLYLWINYHFYNPRLVPGVQDSSGMRLWFTKSLRQYDAGIFDTGMAVTPLGQILPGGYSNLTMHGHCSKECLSQSMGETSEIHIYKTLLHTHDLGTGVRLRHYRDGVELPFVATNVQSDLDKNKGSRHSVVTIKKGDNLITECIYNTTGRQFTSFGGEGMLNEMCISTVFYYPRIELYECSSVPSQGQMASSLGFIHREFMHKGQSVILDGLDAEKTFNEYMNETGVFTDKETKEKYQRAIVSGEILQTCNNGNKKFASDGTFTQVPLVSQPYVPRMPSCGYVNG